MTEPATTARLGAMRAWLLSSVLAIVLPLTSCSDDAIDPLRLPVTEPGPWSVGYRTWQIRYRPPAQDADREVAVHVWYPTDVVEGMHPRYAGFLRDDGTVVDAAAAAPAYAEGYPVVAHSHGHRGLAEGGWRLHRHFATHGWVAVSVSHEGDLLSDGSSADEQPITHWQERPLDVSAALDALAALPDGDALRAANTSRVLLSGHSRGAYTTWAAGGAAYDVAHLQAECDAEGFALPCTDAQIARFEDGFRDARVVAGLPMAGNGHGELYGGAQGMRQVPIPMLLMTAEADPVGAETLVADVTLPAGFSWVEIAEGCHELFNLGCGAAQDDLGFPVVAGYALAFGRRHVLRDDTPEVVAITDGSGSVSERATFH